MPKQLTDDLVSLIFNAGQILKEKAREKTNFKDCSFMHIQTLHYIKDRDGAAMRDVAFYLHITPPSATSLVNSLVKKSLVKRVVDKKDRRTVKLQITKTGIDLLKNNLKKIASVIENGINTLSENEKNNFVVILKKISR